MSEISVLLIVQLAGFIIGGAVAWCLIKKRGAVKGEKVLKYKDRY